MDRIVIFSVLILALFGCMMGPNYQRPVVETPPAWRVEEKEARDVANTRWWEQFNDPVLTELILTALRENKDLKMAVARVEEFVGRYTTTRAGLFPQAFGGGSAGRSRTTERGAAPITSTVENPADSYQAFLNASWEIDVWGRLRRSTEAARADILSNEEGRLAVILSLVTSMASAYVNLRDLDKQLEISEHTTKIREDSYELFKLRFEGGLISELELSQVKSEYEQALATIPLIKKTIAQQENALSILLGQDPGPIPRGKSIDDLTLPSVPAGLPSDLLDRRPDIRQAEQNLISANAQIGVAKSLYFPTVSLTGLFGVASTDLSKLFTGPARTWSYAVPLSTPVFTGGAISGQVKASEAVQRQALIQYQKSIQTAFREVNDSLADQKWTRDQLEIQRQQRSTLGTYAELARLRFDNGYVSYIEVLDAERSLFNTELQVVQTQGVLFQALVNLYKAMGGGWIVDVGRESALK
jgi:outer membrane protein, multidrug efflux system